jgi:hypothetical protein
MNGIRRGLLVLGLTVATFAGAAGSTAPASATFADSAAVSTSTSTETVAPPTDVVGKLTCGRPSATMSATWKLSTSARVSGYLVSVYFSDGFVQTEQVSSTATSWSASIDPYWVTMYSVRYSVTTQTDYKWTKESPLTGSFQC